MIKFQKKRFIVKNTLILLVLVLKNSKNLRIRNNNFNCIFMFLYLIFLIKPLNFKFSKNNFFTFYLNNKKNFFYKIFFHYLILKNLLENPKILIKKKLYAVTYNKTKKQKIKKWFWKIRLLRKFKLSSIRLKYLKKLFSTLHLNYNSPTSILINKKFTFFTKKNPFFFHRKKRIKNNSYILINKIKKNSRKIWSKLKKKTFFFKKMFVHNKVTHNQLNYFLLSQIPVAYNNNFSYLINFFNLCKLNNFNKKYKLTNVNNIFTLSHNTIVTLFNSIKKKIINQKFFLLYCRLFFINFYELFFKTKVFLKIYKNTPPTWSLNILLNFLVKKFKNIQSFIGKGFFLKEMFYIIFYMFKYKDITIFKNWLITNLERMTFIKHRKFFYFLKLILKNIFSKITKLFNIRGFYLDVTGKISVSGDAQTRRYIITRGFTSFSSYTYKLNYTKFTIRTTTGILGLSLAISYV